MFNCNESVMKATGKKKHFLCFRNKCLINSKLLLRALQKYLRDLCHASKKTTPLRALDICSRYSATFKRDVLSTVLCSVSLSNVFFFFNNYVSLRYIQLKKC